MKKIVLIILSLLGFAGVTGASAAGEREEASYHFDSFESPAPATRLSRMSMGRIEAAHLYYRARMRRVKAVIYATLVGAGAAVAGGVYAWNTRRKSSIATNQAAQQLRDLEDTILTPPPATTSAMTPEQRQCTLDQIHVLEGRIKRDAGLSSDHSYNGTFWGTVVGQPLRVALTLGLAGLVVTTGHQVFRVASGTLGEILQLWWHGYDYWYSSLEEQVRTLMNELRESFYQARKVAQQTSTEQQLVIARQQRRAPLAYEVSSHYRLDIVTMYQRLVGAFERLVALMTIIAPSEHHDLMQQNVATIIAQCERLASSLEADLNENTHGMLTHYSNKTLDLYHECSERMTIFLTTYRVYLRK